MKTTATLEIKRFLGAAQAVTETRCFPGRITVLTDAAGVGSLLAYQQALSGQKTVEKFSVRWQGVQYEPADHMLVGFRNELQPAMSLSEYLQDSGYSSEEVAELLIKFELDTVSYMMCGQLSATAARQLELLAALRSSAPVLILNDPFQPFNGRWREHFAELIIDNSAAEQRVVVITNLSFTPQSWSQREEISYVDVGKAAERAATREAARLKLEEAAAAAAREAAEQAEKAEKKNGAGQTADKELPEIVSFAYQHTRDFLFDPLARLSTTLRSNSGAVFFAGLAFVTLVMGFVMFPNYKHYQARLRSVAADFGERSEESPVISRVAPQSPGLKRDATLPVTAQAEIVTQVRIAAAPDKEESEPGACEIQVALPGDYMKQYLLDSGYAPFCEPYPSPSQSVPLPPYPYPYT